MCLPACTLKLADVVSRRAMLRSLGVSACAAGAASAGAPRARAEEEPQPRVSFKRIVDLTHTLTTTFPSPWKDPLVMEQIGKLGKDKWNIFRWHLIEHVGTHLDAPFHCTDLGSADRIPVEELVGPLAIIDVREKATADPDAQLTVEDLKAWERRNGAIPEGAVVALNSGWDARVHDARLFLGVDDKGRYHLPGFSLEAARFLHEQRQVKGIATDTMNLDPASAGDFPVHHYWLGQGKWGLENVANLGQLPPVGATIIVGAPKIAGCSGGPSRVVALV
jgi:kynurenine formamidase